MADARDVDALAGLQMVTDGDLAKLDVDDLMVELLDRVRDLLEADTAAVLLLDEKAGVLVACAARGLEEEVRENVRVPLGVGFAGRVAATKKPMLLDRVDSSTVANPILWEKGIQVMLGVPMLEQDQVLGVLHVGRLEQRPFSEQEIGLLQVVAERVSGAIQSAELAAESTASRAQSPSRVATSM